MSKITENNTIYYIKRTNKNGSYTIIAVNRESEKSVFGHMIVIDSKLVEPQAWSSTKRSLVKHRDKYEYSVHLLD